MSDLIGTRHDDRIACTDTVHPLTAINPHYDRYVLGACRCHPDATHRQEGDR